MSNLRRPLDRILARDDAHELLKDYYDDLIACVQAGLNVFMSFYPDELRQLSQKRTLANVLNDTICYEAIRRFGDGKDKNVTVNEDHLGHFFIFFGKAAIRFKKVDTSLRPSNVQTGRQVHISWQQLEIKGIDPLTFLNLGYQPNILFTEIDTVSLSCRRRHVLWEIPLANKVTAYLFDHEGKAQPAMGAPVVRPKLTGKAVRNG